MLRGHGKEMGDELIQKMGGVSMIWTRGAQGEIPMYIDLTHFPKLAICI
jgi:hypothetical protein